MLYIIKKGYEEPYIKEVRSCINAHNSFYMLLSKMLCLQMPVHKKRKATITRQSTCIIGLILTMNKHPMAEKDCLLI